MIDDFRSEMFSFIYMGGMTFSGPQIIQVDADGVFQNPVISLASKYYVGTFLKHIMIHSLLDAVFESENPGLEDLGYVQKYKKLPESNAYEIAVKETYRVLTMVRNVITHCKSKLASAEGRLVCSYMKKSNRNKELIPISIDITSGGLNILYSIAVMRSKLKGDVDAYHQLMIVAMYNSAKGKVADFQDEYRFSSDIPLRTVSTSQGVRWSRRYRLIAPDFIADEDSVRFTRFSVPEQDQAWAGDEYLYSEDGSDYIIPGEFLDEDGSIFRRDLVNWKVKNKVIRFG